MAIVSFDSRGSKRRVPSVSYADSPYGQNLKLPLVSTTTPTCLSLSLSHGGLNPHSNLCWGLAYLKNETTY
jgi:hypothetical protein